MTFGGNLAILALVLLPCAWGCSEPEGWKSQSVDQRLSQAQILVYGKFLHEKSDRPITDRTLDRVDVDFQVYCVLKSSKGPVAENITIADAYPPTCIMEDVNIVTKGKEAVVMLRKEGNFYSWHQVNVQSALFPVSDTILKRGGSVRPQGCCKLSRPAKADQVCSGVTSDDTGAGYNVESDANAGASKSNAHVASAVGFVSPLTILMAFILMR